MFGVKNLKTGKRHSPVIKFLTIVVSAILLIYLVYPYWPKVQYYFNSVLNKGGQNPISYTLLNTSAAQNEETVRVATEDLIKQNVLSIPKLGIKTNIIEGETLDVLDTYEGVWRENSTSTPLVAGNMVLAGHRFQYLPPNTNTFYNLEEMKVGDDIYVEWQGRTFWYKVFNTMLVNPDQIEIRNADPNLVREITLYTCTPLYTSDKRFVVKANLIGYQ